MRVAMNSSRNSQDAREREKVRRFLMAVTKHRHQAAPGKPWQFVTVTTANKLGLLFLGRSTILRVQNISFDSMSV